MPQELYPGLDASVLTGVFMLVCLAAGFVGMTRGAPQALVMPLLACIFLAAEPNTARTMIETGFREFAAVALLFTAVAVPAHQIQRSNAFLWIGARLGRHVGLLFLRHPAMGVTALVLLSLLTTFVAAGLCHNVTAILVMTPITIGLCECYRVPSRWLLCGQLVASNLGGFSTSWGDVPNAVETQVWQLSNAHFFKEILPANMMVLIALSAAVLALTWRQMKKDGGWGSRARMADMAARYRQSMECTALDLRLLAVGISALVGFISVQYVWKEFEVAAAAGTILIAAWGERPDHRLFSLQALDLGLYMTLAAIFVLANCIDHSIIGRHLRTIVASSGGAPWMIAGASYLGTAFTEAASWATATAASTYAINPSRAAAWALGGGICAGSSSLLTAASAGIILASESRRFPGHEVTFGRYLGFGIVTSLMMLLFYALYASVL